MQCDAPDLLRAVVAVRPAVAKAPFLPKPFFARDPLICARELIGTELVWGKCSGVIVETEAYLTLDDEACHTFTRPSTRAFVERNVALGCIAIFQRSAIAFLFNDALTILGIP